MKYLQNGSIGDIYASGHVEYGVTIAEANESFIEVVNASGDHLVFMTKLFDGFDFTSYGTPVTPRFAPGVVIQNAVVAVPPPPLGTITGWYPQWFEYEDSNGAAHAAANVGFSKIL